jgi:hypothetical protein
VGGGRVTRRAGLKEYTVTHGRNEWLTPLKIAEPAEGYPLQTCTQTADLKSMQTCAQTSQNSDIHQKAGCETRMCM